MMDIHEIEARAQGHFQERDWRECFSWSLAAVFTKTGLSWPYFLIAESLWNLGSHDTAKSFYSLYRIRKKEKDPEGWFLETERRLSDGQL